MCGILFQYGPDQSGEKFTMALKKLTHRGPDYSGQVQSGDVTFGHTRLAIINPESGSQPIVSDEMILTVNGEIYNYEDLQEKWGPFDEYGLPRKLKSDCEVIISLFNQFDNFEQKLSQLTGMFSFVLYHGKTKDFLVARDPLGIIPLYYGVIGDNWFCGSEIKSLIELGCSQINEFPPGHYLTSDLELTRWFQLPSQITEYSFDKEVILQTRERLISSVKSHLMSDVSYAVLLSGGLDSSIICSIVRHLQPDQELHTFSVGLKDSPDLISARKMADHLGTIHHEIVFEVKDALEVIPDVIKSIETYDTTTIRASTPMYLMAKYISDRGFKMVLSGEGADEIFGGYLYFKKAPTPKDFHEECLRKVDNLHSYDLLRANKSMMAFGIEVRVPFLDTPFFTWALKIDPKYKMCSDRIEKWILRQAFSDLLISEITDRQKEQFSDGVGYDWIDGIQTYVETLDLSSDYPVNQPRTAEERWYRSIFEDEFPNLSHLVPWGFSVACSSPQVESWDKFTSDPSGRYLTHHSSTKV